MSAKKTLVGIGIQFEKENAPDEIKNINIY